MIFTLKQSTLTNALHKPNYEHAFWQPSQMQALLWHDRFGTKDEKREKGEEKKNPSSYVAVQLKENTLISPGEFPGSRTQKLHFEI